MWKDSLVGLKHWPEEMCLLGYSPGERLAGSSSCSTSVLQKPAGAIFVFSLFSFSFPPFFCFLFFFFLFSFSFLFFFFNISLPYSNQWALSSHTNLCHNQNTSISWRGASTYVWCPGFYVLWLGFCSCHLGDAPWSPGSGGQGSFRSWVSWGC